MFLNTLGAGLKLAVLSVSTLCFDEHMETALEVAQDSQL